MQIELIIFFTHPFQEVPIIRMFFVLKSAINFMTAYMPESFAHRHVSRLSIVVCVTVGNLTAVFNTQI